MKAQFNQMLDVSLIDQVGLNINNLYLGTNKQNSCSRRSCCQSKDELFESIATFRRDQR